MNLGWKLAQVVKGVSPDSLLDTYHAERHPVAARVLHNTMAQTALLRPDERSKAARVIKSAIVLRSLTQAQRRASYVGYLHVSAGWKNGCSARLSLALCPLAATFIPSQPARIYWAHARQALFPNRSESLRDRAGESVRGGRPDP